MLKAIAYWAIPLTALLVVGPFAGMLTASLHTHDGSDAATPLVCEAPIRGILAALGALALAGLTGAGAGRILGAGWGLASAGFVLAWAAWGTGNIDQILRQTQSASTLWTLSLEGLLVGAAAVGIAALILRVAHAHPTAPDTPPPPRGEQRGSGIDSSAVIALGVAFVTACVVAWVMVQDKDTLKGQTVAGAALAGMFGAFAGRLGIHRAPVLVFFVAIAILAAAGPAAATVVHPGSWGSGGGSVISAAYAGRLLPLARPLPLDWMAGAFVGIPVGISWAASMTDSHSRET